MLPLVLLSSALLALTGVPPAQAGGLPVCNAKHRRPANPYGSVLSEGLKPVIDNSAAPGATVKPVAGTPAVTASKPAPKTARVSRAELNASFAPCGRKDRA